MSDRNVLSDGSLNSILQLKNDRLTPLLQILGHRVVNNGRVRLVISDGVSLCQHCIVISADAEQQLSQGLLEKYTVIRVDHYTVSSIQTNPEMPIILVNQLTILKRGYEINHKLEPGEPFDGSVAVTAPGPSNASTTPLSDSTNHRSLQSAFSRPAPIPPAITHGANTLKSENACPINQLSPFYNAWVIRVRVTAKTPIRTWNNKRGEGKLFSFDCCDETGETRITAFKGECDRFFDFIERDRVYLISKGVIKAIDKRYCSLNCEYEITLNQSSIIELCQEAVEIAVPKTRFKFIHLADLVTTKSGTMLDVIGVIRLVMAPEPLISKKTSKPLTKRDIIIADMSLTEARVTLWNDMATDFSGGVGQIVALKSAVVGDFKGKTLSTSPSTVILLEPDLPETLILRNWFNTTGSMATFTSLTCSGESSAVSGNQRFLCQITKELLTALNQRGQVYSIFTGMIAATNHTSKHLYKACGNNGCMKKVTDGEGENAGMYHCAKCNRDAPTFQWRVMLNIVLEDATGQLWVTLFQDNAEKLLGRSAQELAQLYEMSETEYSKMINALRFKKFNLRVGSKVEEYNGEQRLRTIVSNIMPQNTLDRSRRLMTMINILAAQVNA